MMAHCIRHNECRFKMLDSEMQDPLSLLIHVRITPVWAPNLATTDPCVAFITPTV